MKKFLLRLALFIVLVAIADWGYGLVFERLMSRTRGGEMLKAYEVEHVVTPDILVLGSSRSTHHYDPQILEDSLGGSVYVAGKDGMGVVAMYPRYDIVASRRVPRVVILDITQFDFAGDNLENYLADSRPLWGRSAVADSVILAIDPTERIKLMSRGFRRNSSLFALAKGLLSADTLRQGYDPIYGINHGQPAVEATGGKVEMSAEKRRILTNMAARVRRDGAEFIIVQSPNYQHLDPEYSVTIRRIADEAGVPFIDLGDAAGFAGADSLWADVTHLNYRGAEEFSRRLGHILRAQMAR